MGANHGTPSYEPHESAGGVYVVHRLSALQLPAQCAVQLAEKCSQLCSKLFDCHSCAARCAIGSLPRLGSRGVLLDRLHRLLRSQTSAKVSSASVQAIDHIQQRIYVLDQSFLSNCFGDTAETIQGKFVCRICTKCYLLSILLLH